ncbi:MAG: urea transporter [Sedimenticola sp.]
MNNPLPHVVMPKSVKTFLNSYSEILFMSGSGVGAVVLIITLISPAIGITGIISVLTAFAFARFIGMGGTFLTSGFYTYNALLVGLSLGYLFQISPLSVLFAAVAGVMTLLVSVMANSIFMQYLRLPILSLPFVAVSSVAYLASSHYSNLYVNTLYVHNPLIEVKLPLILEGFFTSLGAIFFLPQVTAGILLFIVLLWHSRIQALLAMAGFLLGGAVSGLLGGSTLQAFSNPNNFNFILIAITLGGLFLVPSPKSYILAAIGVIVAAVLQDAVNLFWSLYGIPVFTLPFNMVTLTFLYVLGLVGFPYVADRIGKTPEATLDDYWSRRVRFSSEQRRLNLPFSGNWMVWQGFDGSWTHQGAQRHACDFIIEVDGQSHRASGSQLDDYFAWRKPVFSPCKGRVVAINDHVQDNLPGEVNRIDNWGNWIIIASEAGWHVVIAHCALGSMAVTAGDWVEAGTRIALCGNSGYSPQPHIHMHIQQSGEAPGDATLPFLFQAYASDECFHPAAIPEQGELVEPLEKDQTLLQMSTLLLDQTYRYQFRDDRGVERSFSAKIVMDELGETALETASGHLYFNRDNSCFYFYRIEGSDPALALMFSVLPRMPLHYRRGLRWTDKLPMAASYRGVQLQLLNLVRSLLPNIGVLHYQAQWQDYDRISGQIIKGRRTLSYLVELGDSGLFRRISLEGVELTYQGEEDELS